MLIAELESAAIIRSDSGSITTANEEFKLRCREDDEFLKDTNCPTCDTYVAYEDDPIFVNVIQFESDDRIINSIPNDPSTKVWFEWKGGLAWCFFSEVCETHSVKTGESSGE